MIDREELIKDMEHCINTECFRCPRALKDGGAICNDFRKSGAVLIPVSFVKNVIELLKKQEAVTIKKTKEHGFGVYGGICPKCKNWIQSAHSYCGFCGQEVKWK